MHKIFIFIISLFLFLFSGRIVFVSTDIYQILIGIMGLILPFTFIKWSYKKNPLLEVARNNGYLAVIFYIASLSYFTLEVGILLAHYGLTPAVYSLVEGTNAVALFFILLCTIKSINKVNKRRR